MTINQLQAEMIVCMKQGDRERKAVISDLIAQIKKAAIDKGCRDNITEEFVNAEILKAKKNGNYCVLKVDPNYTPNPIETKQVFGITFEQGRNELDINTDLLENIVTENKDLPESAKRDLLISLITLKYTQSNSVCYVKD